MTVWIVLAEDEGMDPDVEVYTLSILALERARVLAAELAPTGTTVRHIDTGGLSDFSREKGWRARFTYSGGCVSILEREVSA